MRKDKIRLFYFLVILIILFLVIIFYNSYSKKNSEGFEGEFKLENSPNAIVIVEPRAHKLLESVIENFDEFIDKSWDLYVFHGKSHKDYAMSATQKIKERKVYLLPLETDNLTADEYNALFRQTDFWNRINAENILVFQTDTLICKDSQKKINDFMKFDYIGCGIDNNLIGPNSYWGPTAFYGVGGLSFRKKKFMIECINKNKDNILPEDMLFSKCVQDFSKNKPSVDDLNYFCTQNKYVKNSFGIHKTHVMLTDKENKEKLYSYCPIAKKLEGS